MPSNLFKDLLLMFTLRSRLKYVKCRLLKWRANFRTSSFTILLQFEKSSSSFGNSDRPRQKKGKGIGKQDEYFCLTLLKFMGDLGDTFEFLGDSLPFDAGEPDAG